MGIGTSKEEEARLAHAVHKLSKVELKYIESVFGELSYTSEEGKKLIKRPTWLNRETFASKFGLPDFLGEQLFAAFDRDQNEVVDLNEFLVGMALCLHGSVKDKCQLLFKIFNLNGDEGITKEDLSTVLISALHSTHGMLQNMTSKGHEKGTVGWEMSINEAVERIVTDAFEKCDTSRNAKLEMDEFEHWLHKNPKLINSIFLFSCPRPADNASNYDVITTPVGGSFPAFESTHQEESGEIPASLSELFSDASVTVKDVDAESFFDSLGKPDSTNTSSSELPSTSVTAYEEEDSAMVIDDISGVIVGTAKEIDDGSMVIDERSVVIDDRSVVIGEGSEVIDDRSVVIGEGSGIIDDNSEVIGEGSELIDDKSEVIGEGSELIDDKSKVIEDPSTLELSEDILMQHHLMLKDERISTMGSEMSLVSLGQSTGDLSTLDNEANVLSDAEISVKLKKPSNVFQDVASLETDVDIADVNDDAADATNGKENDAMSWHPLKEVTSPTSEQLNFDDDSLFQDASDEIQLESENTNNSSGTGPEGTDSAFVPKDRSCPGNTEILLYENRSSDSQSALDAKKPGLPDPAGLSVIDSEKVFDGKSEQNETLSPQISIPKPKSEFHEVINESLNQRPETLKILSGNKLATVELSPSENTIGKPTLRQLAEIKEFDLATMEDSKSVLPEVRFAAWQPSPETKLLIDATSRGNLVDKHHLTYPSVLLETSLGDPVKDLVAKFLGEQDAAKRPVPMADNVTMNDAGLRDLLSAQCWRGAIDWTAKYLTAHGQGVCSGSPTGPFNHTPKLLQIWFVRIALLFKLKSFSSAEAELNVFANFDKPDLYYEYYADLYPGMKGSLVPFSLRVIHAELPQHNGRPQETLDRSYRLISTIKTVLANLQSNLSEHGEETTLGEEERSGAIKLWKSREIRILFSIGNCLLGIKEYSLGLEIFTEIMQKKPETKASIISGVGRLHLQLGDINLAKRYFKKVEQLSSGDPKTLSVTVMNRGFVALAEGRYEEAYGNFESVSKLDPDNSSAWNNAAVCLLFQGKVKEASSLLETLVWKSPKRNLHEDIVFNLCTIYELETSRAFQKKQKLLDLVSRHKGDGFNIQSLKLT